MRQTLNALIAIGVSIFIFNFGLQAASSQSSGATSAVTEGETYSCPPDRTMLSDFYQTPGIEGLIKSAQVEDPKDCPPEEIDEDFLVFVDEGSEGTCTTYSDPWTADYALYGTSSSSSMNLDSSAVEEVASAIADGGPRRLFKKCAKWCRRQGRQLVCKVGAEAKCHAKAKAKYEFGELTCERHPSPNNCTACNNPANPYVHCLRNAVKNACDEFRRCMGPATSTVPSPYCTPGGSPRPNYKYVDDECREEVKSDAHHCVVLAQGANVLCTTGCQTRHPNDRVARCRCQKECHQTNCNAAKACPWPSDCTRDGGLFGIGYADPKNLPLCRALVSGDRHYIDCVIR
jgi:hypothetical protein